MPPRPISAMSSYGPSCVPAGCVLPFTTLLLITTPMAACAEHPVHEPDRRSMTDAQIALVEAHHAAERAYSRVGSCIVAPGFRMMFTGRRQRRCLLEIGRRGRV